MKDGSVLVLQTRSPDLFNSYSTTKATLDFVSDEDFLTFLLDAAKPVISYVQSKKYRQNGDYSISNGHDNGHVDSNDLDTSRRKEDTINGSSNGKRDALNSEPTQESIQTSSSSSNQSISKSGESETSSPQNHPNSDITNETTVSQTLLSKTFHTVETQTANPSMSTHRNARIGGCRSRKYVLSPGRTPENTAKKAKTSAKVIEVVIKTEPEDASSNESSRLFYPVDIACGQCPKGPLTEIREQAAADHHGGLVSFQEAVCSHKEPRSYLKNQDDPAADKGFAYVTSPDTYNPSLEITKSIPPRSRRPFPETEASLITESEEDNFPRKRSHSEDETSFQCCCCPEYSFSNPVDLWSHIQGSCSKTVIPSKCCFCPTEVVGRGALLCHINRVHCWSSCEKCGELLPASQKANHIKLHLKSSKDSHCYACDYRNENPNIIHFHAQSKHLKLTGILIESTVSDIISCESCGKQFRKREHLISHRRKCKGFPPTIQQASAKEDKSSVVSRSVEHLEVEHRDEKMDIKPPVLESLPISCLYCDKTHVRMNNAIKHIIAVHPDKVTDNKTKEFCNNLLSRYRLTKKQDRAIRALLEVSQTLEHPQCSAGGPLIKEDSLQTYSNLCPDDLEGSANNGLINSGDELGDVKEVKSDITTAQLRKSPIYCVHCGRKELRVKDALNHLTKRHADKISDAETTEYCKNLALRYRGSNLDVISRLKELSGGSSVKEETGSAVASLTPPEPILFGPSCEVCGRGFSTRSGLWNHKRLGCQANTASSSMPIEDYAKPSVTSSLVEIPPNLINGHSFKDGRIPCPYCAKQCSRVGNMILHLKRAHRDKLTNKLTKRYCEKLLSNYNPTKKWRFSAVKNSIDTLTGVSQ